MCGIVGYLKHNGPVDIDQFNVMRDALKHRGPDGANTKVLDRRQVVLGHRRLSIIDLSEKGAQPMGNEDGSIWLTYNGEIYNFQELRRNLLQAGHVFRSETDSEVLIHGYEEWGMESLLGKLKGMFAFALWDANKQILLAARDRMGIKPFYYYQDGDQFIFASEIKAILKSPATDSSLDITAMTDFLVYRFIPSPKTIFRNVRKLSPAHFLKYDFRTAKLQTNPYWELSSEAKVHGSYREVLEKTQALMSTSIREHLISDVPVGVFLSGGYDSSTLVHYMSEFGYPTKSFSIGFAGWERTEHEDARMVAEKYRTEHHEEVLPSDLGQELSRYMYHYDEPIGGTSFLPTFAVSELASKDVKVVVGGDGGDEVFAGYNWYYRIMDRKQSLKSKINGFLRGSRSLLAAYHQEMTWSGFSYREMRELFNDHPDLRFTPSDLWIYEKYDRPDWPDLKRLQHLDIKTFMPEVICTKVDRASMAFSLEVRVPFLDHELMEFVFSLDPSVYYQPGVKKRLLHDIMKPHFPPEILAKKKQGFGAPVRRRMEFSEALINGSLVRKELISADVVKRYREKNQWRKIWALYILENWYRCWKD